MLLLRILHCIKNLKALVVMLLLFSRIQAHGISSPPPPFCLYDPAILTCTSQFGYCQRINQSCFYDMASKFVTYSQIFLNNFTTNFNPGRGSDFKFDKKIFIKLLEISLFCNTLILVKYKTRCSNIVMRKLLI